MVNYRIKAPLSEKLVRKLLVGDNVTIDGVICVFRDRAFDYAKEVLGKGGKLPVDLHGAIHWHCGPITKKVAGKWVVSVAGPTTSRRFDKEEPRAIREWGVRLVIGKGGLGQEASQAMNECGAAYASAVGGAASHYAEQIKDVIGVYWLELGMPEAMWLFKVKGFGPLQVTMDSYGNNLYEDVRKKAYDNLTQIKRKIDTS